MMLKLALKEHKKHRLIYLFVILQISVTFLIGVSCSTILSNQVSGYKCFADLMKKDGRFMNSISGIRTPEADIGTGISGIDILSKYLRKTEVISCYHVLGELMENGYSPEWNMIAYDKRLAESYTPLLSDGEWYKEPNFQKGELRAVISQNYYGVEVGDYLSLLPYDGALEEVRIKVIGMLDQNAQIIRFQTSDNMVSNRNFLNSYDNENELPAMLLLKDDFSVLYHDSGMGNRLLWPSEMTFLYYEEGITDEEIMVNDEFIKKYMNAQVIEPLSDVREKSIRCLWEQVMEVLPVFVAALLFSIITTISVSVLGAKYAVENYRIYHLIGLSGNKCLMIQLCLDLLILAKCFLFTIVFCVIIKIVLESNSSLNWINVGPVQFLICMTGGLIWLTVSFLLQKMVLKDSSLWGLQQND